MKKDFRDSVFSVVRDLMRADPSVVVLHNDTHAFILDEIRKEFSARAINVGVAEQNMLGLASGLAASGKKVFVYGQIPHLMRAWEQIKVGVCIPNLPVTILGLGAGLSMGMDGPTHHGTEDVALMRVLANMTIFNPADWVCAEACVKMAYEAATPHYIRLDKHEEEPLYNPANVHIFDRGYAVFGDADRIIISTGIETHRARRFARTTVVDLYRLKPAPVLSIAASHRLEVWDEHHVNGGLFSIVAEMFASVDHHTISDTFLGAIKRDPLPNKPLAWVDDGYGIPFGGE